MTIELGLVETTAVALAVLLLGYLLNRLVPFLKNNNIPEPVVGGIVFAALSSAAYSSVELSFNFDMTLKMPLMLVFFTTVGLGANVRLLKRGGPKLFWFLLIATAYLIVQDATGVLFATLLVLGVVPCLYMVLEDLERAARWIWRTVGGFLGSSADAVEA